jgi:type II secretory ATPase GspE/PulE/Tfp pilus assembly ATPase PilB-like protein
MNPLNHQEAKSITLHDCKERGMMVFQPLLSTCRDLLGDGVLSSPGTHYVIVLTDEKRSEYWIVITYQTYREKMRDIKNIESQLKQKFDAPITTRHYASVDTIMSLFNDSASGDGLVTHHNQDDSSPVAKKKLDEIVAKGIQRGASDFGFKVDGGKGYVNYCVDGLMLPPEPIPADDVRKVVNAAFQIHSEDMAGDIHDSKITNKNINLDLRTDPIAKIERVRLRTIKVPSHNGFTFSSRIILTNQSKSFQLNQLGFDDAQLNAVKHLINQPDGILLVVAPTNNGKTVTLKCMYENIAHDRRIVLMEDPVEYIVNHPQVIQEPINDHNGITPEELTKAALRQFPNVIGISELRSPELASECVKSALSGHLMASTLHVNDALSVPKRLKSLGVDYDTQALRGLFKGIIAQRLLPKLCPDCKIKSHRPGEFQHNEQGCNKCDGLGVKGRTFVAETVVYDDNVYSLIQQGDLNGVEKYLRHNGWRSMLDYAEDKIKAGEVDRKHVINELGDYNARNGASFDYGSGEFVAATQNTMKEVVNA